MPELTGQLREGPVFSAPAFRQVTGRADFIHVHAIFGVGFEVQCLVTLAAFFQPGQRRCGQCQANQGYEGGSH